MWKEIRAFCREMLQHLFQSRLFALALLFIFLFSVLTVKLFRLQIIYGKQYMSQYQGQTLKEVSSVGTRGNIYDREGKLLAYNALQYNITISADDAYDTSDRGINSRNLMLYHLAKIIGKYGYSVKSQYKISEGTDGGFRFTTGSEEEKRRFLSNVLGVDITKITEKQMGMDAEAVFESSVTRYRFDQVKEENGQLLSPSVEDLFTMVSILYTMRLTSYQRFQSTTIVENISKECMTEISENKGELLGVNVEDVSVRRYNYAPYLSHIIGYTGKIQESQLQDLQEQDPSYEINDTIGVWGLEKSEESILKGKKGRKVMYLNSVGSILKVVSDTESQSGDDLYTTISANDSIAIYHLLEQELAGILVSKITEDDIVNQNVKQSQIMIPVKDAYYQLVHNHVLDVEHFRAEDAKPAEKQIAESFSAYKESVMSRIDQEMSSGESHSLSELPRDMQAFIVYLYDYINREEAGIINSDDPKYLKSVAKQQWKDDRISLRDFIMKGIEEDWVNASHLELTGDYSDTGTIYQLFVQYLENAARNDASFDQLLYKYAISAKRIRPSLLMMALLEQGLLPDDPGAYRQLSGMDNHFAYTYFIDKIRRIQITPAQLALDPCNGSVVVTDVHTGKIRALVTYPGFDNNRISDPVYLRKCNDDLSLPLLNNATQTQLAPGSSFKPITSVAALETGAITTDTTLECTGIFEEVTPAIRCWIYPLGHGRENLVDGIKNSCNYFFAALGHRLSMNQNGQYDQQLGLSRIKTYATMFGLADKSGVELDEASPRISDKDPERSAMGQGTHAYNNVQLNKYITAVANRGTLYDLSIVDHVSDPAGSVISTTNPKVDQELSISPSTWNAVHTGLREVITEGVAKKVFQGERIAVAGKTGTAQEREDRGNHAVFVSYAPYDAPQISVTVTIPYGYSSGNAANLAKLVYHYCFGETTLDQILQQDAGAIQSMSVSD